MHERFLNTNASEEESRLNYLTLVTRTLLTLKKTVIEVEQNYYEGVSF